MFELEEQHRILEQMIRNFCEKEIAPHVEAMENGEILPFDLMRNLSEKFGLSRFRAEKYEKDKEEKAEKKERNKEEEWRRNRKNTKADGKGMKEKIGDGVDTKEARRQTRR